MRRQRHQQLVDFAAHAVWVNGQEVHLTPTEFSLLRVLVLNRGLLLTHGQLLTEVWGPGYEQMGHYLRFHMAGLRRKLEDDPARPQHL